MGEFPGLERKWQVYLVHHTHVDIGYTEPQPLVLRKHAEYLAQALDLSTATDHLPAGERFCWTCEVAWTVRAFLQRYPERGDELRRRVAEGRVEITALYLQLTDLFAEDLLRGALEYAAELAEHWGVEVVSAMNDDVNGWAWGLPRFMAERGVRYFDVAINETRARGVRPRPTACYWAALGGERVLMWHGDHYMRGNSAGIGHDKPEEALVAYLRGLEQSGYPHDAVELRVQGQTVDNAPPGAWLPGFIGDWNRRHTQVRLQLVTPRVWFEHVEQHWPVPIPEWRAGWPDWWADGNGAALYESALVREAQADLVAAEATGAELDAERRETAREAAMFFCEHTWGAWCSTDDPEALESRAGWNFKAGYAYTAAVESRQLLQEALASCWQPAEQGPAVAVFNPLPHARTDVVEMTFPDDLLPGETAAWVPDPARQEEGPPLHLVEEGGRATAVARVPAIGSSARRPAQRVRFLAREVPARGWKLYRVAPGGCEDALLTSGQGCVLENAHWRLEADPERGGVVSLIEQRSGRELVQTGEHALNQLICETVADPEGRERICRWGELRHEVPFVRRSPLLEVRPGPALPFGRSLILEGGGGDLPHLRSEVVLYDDLPRVDFLNTLTKAPTAAAEGLYQAFPLAVDNPTVYLDVPGAVLRPGVDQVRGTATDWHSLQHYFAVAGADLTVVVASPEVPLVQVNGINTGRWWEELPAHNGVVMSWVMNNYWFTNFPAAQGGRVSYRYSLTAWPGPWDPERAAACGAELRQPLRALLLPRGGRPK